MTELERLTYNAQRTEHKLDDPDTALAHRQAEANGALCHACPLYGCGQGPVPAAIPSGAVKLAIVTEAPAGWEVEQGQPLIGPAGAAVTAALRTGGIDRHQHALVTHAIACRPPRDDYKRLLKKAKQAHRAKCDEADELNLSHPLMLLPHVACQPRIDRELAVAKERGAKVVLAIGNLGLRMTAKHFGIPYATERAAPGAPRLSNATNQHGHPLVLEQHGMTVCASMNPALMQRDKRFLPITKEAITRAADIARRGGKIRWEEPEFYLNPSFDVAINVIDALRIAAVKNGTRVVLDIETDSIFTRIAKIRCVGLAGYINGKEVVISVPLRHISGTAWWKPSQEEAVKRALVRLFEEAKLGGHNVIGYDSAVLLAHGLWPREKQAYDTMLAHHSSLNSELNHDLGFVGSQYFEVPHWKENADAKAIDGVDDLALAEYNAKDCLVTLRLVEPTWNDVVRSGMIEPFKVDSKLALIARDMGELGLVYDMDMRFEQFKKQRSRQIKLLEEIRHCIGDPDFNPGSPVQLKEYLFEKQRLTPPLTSKLKPWSSLENDLDEASTNEAALQAILNTGVPDAVAHILDLILQYRAAQKLQGTYIQLIEIAPDEEQEIRRSGRSIYRHEGMILAESATSAVREEDWGDLGVLSLLHPVFKVHRVPSGRFAATPNVLAWPKEMRSMVIAAPGHMLVGGDAEQIEARLFGINSDDQMIIDAFLKGIDLHTYNWATMNKESLVEAERYFHELMAKGGKNDPGIDHCRTIAKVFMYSLSYGSEVDTLFQNMSTKRRPDGKLAFPGLTRQMVQRWYDGWHRLHPATKRYFNRLQNEHRQNGYIESLITKRKLYQPGGWDRNAAANFPQQSTAADLMNEALIDTVKAIPHRSWSNLTGVILQVHDAIVLSVPEARADEACQILKKCMTKQIGNMPFPAAVKKPNTKWSKV